MRVIRSDVEMPSVLWVATNIPDTNRQASQTHVINSSKTRSDRARIHHDGIKMYISTCFLYVLINVLWSSRGVRDVIVGHKVNLWEQRDHNDWTALPLPLWDILKVIYKILTATRCHTSTGISQRLYIKMDESRLPPTIPFGYKHCHFARVCTESFTYSRVIESHMV